MRTFIVHYKYFTKDSPERIERIEAKDFGEAERKVKLECGAVFILSIRKEID